MYKNVTKYGMFVALAMILSYIEVLIPIAAGMGVPGIKLGLANLVVFCFLYTDGIKSAAFVSLVRILLVGLTFGNMSSMLYSLAGGILSLAIMALAKYLKAFSKIGVSILGGISHNIGQVCIAALILNSTKIFVYLPMLLLIGAVTGFVIGTVGSQIIRHIKMLF